MRPHIFTRDQIEKAMDIPSLIESIEQGMILSSQGRVNLAPISMLHFENPPGEVHIKSAHIAGDDRYVIKIASGFPKNPRLGILSSQGLMLLFSRATGNLETILLDEGLLTDIRTAISGAICAKHFAPRKISRIGIIGTGNQAAMQLMCLRYVTDCRDVIVWGRDKEHREQFSKNPLVAGFQIQTVSDIAEISSLASLIITATSSDKPLIFAKDLQPGVHITAVGADQKGKQEIAPDAMLMADTIYVDNLAQCLMYGDLSYAKDKISMDKVVEIGAALQHCDIRDPNAITIADLTGVAVQDAKIAIAVANRLEAIC